MKQALGIVVTALALFVFGFVFWGLNPLPYAAWHVAPDPDAAQAATMEQFPETGVYGVPGSGMTPTDIWAMVYVRHDLPETLPDAGELLIGLIHYLIVALVLAWLLPRGQTLQQHCAKAAALGVAAVIVIEGSDVVWWGYPWAWKAWGAIYHVLVFVLGALVLSKFLPASDDDSADDARAEEPAQ